jgi:XRE family transcriptional regulator of biofilm formation
MTRYRGAVNWWMFLIKNNLFTQRKFDTIALQSINKKENLMIGKRVQQLRNEKGLTLTILAERAGIAKSYLSNLERDIQKNPSIQVLEKIAAVLKVPVESILDQDHAAANKPVFDLEWYELIEEAMTSGVDKKQFREFLEFNKWQLNRPKE